MSDRYVVAALLRSGKLRRVCQEARDDKATAAKEAKELADAFKPNPVVVVTEMQFERNKEPDHAPK